MRGLTFIYFCNALLQHWILRFLHTLEVMDRKRKHNRRFNSTKSKRKGVSLMEYEKNGKHWDEVVNKRGVRLVGEMEE